MTVVPIGGRALTPQLLLNQLLERDDVEAVLIAFKADDCWFTCWSNDSRGSMAMAAMKIFRDVSDFIEDDTP